MLNYRDAYDLARAVQADKDSYGGITEGAIRIKAAILNGNDYARRVMVRYQRYFAVYGQAEALGEILKYIRDTKKYAVEYCGEWCLKCERDTQPGLGLSVDRVAAYEDACKDENGNMRYARDGYICRECINGEGEE